MSRNKIPAGNKFLVLHMLEIVGELEGGVGGGEGEGGVQKLQPLTGSSGPRKGHRSRDVKAAREQAAYTSETRGPGQGLN